MKSRSVIILSLIILLFTSCIIGDEFPLSCESNSDALTIVHDNELREYILYVPSTYEALNPAAIVFNFHGFGSNADDYINDADMRSSSDQNGYILVYPQGSCLDGQSHWNPNLPGTDNKSNADDFGFIESLIGKISGEYNVDSERIYAVGYSNGGMFSFGLALHKSELFAAVGSVSGTMLNCDHSSSHQIPVITINGSSDSVVPYTGSSDYNSVEFVLNYWNNFNNTNDSPITNSINSNGTRIDYLGYFDGTNGASVEHYKIVGGDHYWFDINYQNKNTAELIWDFFNKYDINGLR